MPFVSVCNVSINTGTVCVCVCVRVRVRVRVGTLHLIIEVFYIFILLNHCKSLLVLYNCSEM